MRLFEVIDPDQTAQSVAYFLKGKGSYLKRLDRIEQQIKSGEGQYL